MIDDTVNQTCGRDLQTTYDVGSQNEDARFLRIAVRRCVRNAAGRRSPRNQFERYVSDRLKRSPSDDGPERLTAQVSQLSDEICRRIRSRLPFRSAMGRSPV